MAESLRKIHYKQNSGKVIDLQNKEKMQITELDIYEISPSTDQPRKTFDESSIESLSNSIKEHGIIQPIVVRKVEFGYEIIAGERRWRASKQAGLRKMPAIIKNLPRKEIEQIALVENIQRESLNSIEEANAFKSLIDKHELTQEKIGELLGKSRSYVANTIRLLNLEEELIALIIENKLTSGHGRTILGLRNIRDQIILAKEIIDRNLSVRETEKLVKIYNGNQDKSTKKIEQDPIIREIEENLRDILGTKVNISRSRKKGKIEIEYYSDEELERIISKIR